MSLSELKSGRYRWHRIHVTQAKAVMNREISTSIPIRDVKERLNFVMKRIAELGENDSSSGMLLRLVFIIQAIFYQRDRPILPRKRLDDLSAIAFSILDVQGIKPGVSQLDFLHGEVTTSLSQAFRAMHLHEEAAWEQALVINVAGKSHEQTGEGLWSFATGNRFLRLGLSRMALQQFEESERLLDPTSNNFRKSRLCKILALRLMKRLEEAKILAQCSRELVESVKIAEQRDAFCAELAWQTASIEATELGTLEPIVNLFTSVAVVHTAPYFAEGCLWLHAGAEDSVAADYLKRMRNSSRSVAKGQQEIGTLHTVLKTFDDLEFLRTSTVARIRRMMKLMCTLNELPGINQELLLLAAGTRWFVREGAHLQAAFAMSKYKNLCLCLSEGSSNDVLSILTEIDSDELKVCDMTWKNHKETA